MKLTNESNEILQLILSLSIFPEAIPVHLVSLTCEMKEITLKVDEPLIRKGEVPPGMYFVGKGRLKVVRPYKLPPIKGNPKIIPGCGEVM